MKQIKQETLTLFIFIFLVIQLFLFTVIQIVVLKELKQLKFHMTSDRTVISEPSYNVEQIVKEALKKQNRFIERSSVTLGKIDPQTLKVPVTFTLHPKKIAESMSISLEINGQTLHLKKAGSTYVTTSAFPFSESFLSAKIIVEDKGVIYIEEDESLLFNLADLAFPAPRIQWDSKTSITSHNYHYKGELQFYMEEIDFKSEKQFVNLKHVIESNGKILKEYNILKEKSTIPSDDGMSSIDIGKAYQIDASIPIEKGDIIESYVIGTDRAGFIYRYPLTHFNSKNLSEEEYHPVQCKIFSPDKKEIYTFTKDL